MCSRAVRRDFQPPLARVVDVGATDKFRLSCKSSMCSDTDSIPPNSVLPSFHTGRFLETLTAAALALPGIAWHEPVQAKDDQFTVQGSHLREQGRDAVGAWNATPLKVDTLQAQGWITLGENIDLGIRATQDTWSGATPVATAPSSARSNRPVQTGLPGQLITVGASPMVTGRVLVDHQLRPLAVDAMTGQVTGLLDQPVHTYSSASPETRRQLDLDLRTRSNTDVHQVGLGLSQERDYASGTVRGSHSWSLGEDQQTTFTAALQFTHQRVNATLDHDATPYLNTTAWRNSIRSNGSYSVLQEQRNDTGASLGIVQVMNATSVLQANIGVINQQGYLSNPYKAVSALFIDPVALSHSSGPVPANLQALMEKRPSHRRQWQFGLQWLRYIENTDAALRLNWHHSRDNWAVRSHSLEGQWAQPFSDGWQITPRLRYYTQTAAQFYTPWLVSRQAYRSVAFGGDGQPIVTSFNPALLPTHYSSDTRLAGFGNLSFGLGVSRQLGKGVHWYAGLDWTHQSGKLKAGGGGLGSFADLRWMVAYMGLTVRLDDPLDARRNNPSDKPAHHTSLDSHSHSHTHTDVAMPPGVHFGHWMEPGQWRMGHQMQVVHQGPRLLNAGGASISDTQLQAQGCGATPCLQRPESMRMNMHMLEFMTGISEQLNIMVMSHYMDMAMSSRRIGSSIATLEQPQIHEGRHETGGLGDTHIYAVVKGSSSLQSLNTWAVGLSAPTGASGLRMRRTHQVDPPLVDYSMQLGSGTWDLLVASTWSWTHGPWGWGAQIHGAQRLQSSNAQGYALGNTLQLNAWVTRQIIPSLTLTGRWQHTRQGAIQGKYADVKVTTSPTDNPMNYGGRLNQLGLGAVYKISSGIWQGSEFHLEWMQPLRNTYNGVQLEHRTGLALGWAYHF